MLIALLAAALLHATQESAADTALTCDPGLQICPVIDSRTGKPHSFPADVTRFQTDVETCVHFAGEEPYNEERRRDIDAALKKYCDGAKARLPALRRKYAKDPVNLKRVDAIQAYRVEAGL